MKRSRFTDQQIAFALQRAGQGPQVAEVTVQYQPYERMAIHLLRTVHRIEVSGF